MSKKNNVNPDHYKTAGRLRPGDPGLQELEKQQYAQAQAERTPAPANFIPGAAPVAKEDPAAQSDEAAAEPVTSGEAAPNSKGDEAPSEGTR
jgi:hypothetical protein